MTGAEGKLFNSNTWYSLRMGKTYSQGFNGNQYTGGKLGAKNLSTGLKIGGYGLGAYNAFSITQQYNSGSIGTWTLVTEQASNAYSTLGGIYGAAWGVGWEIGRGITSFGWYQNWKQETWLPWRKENLGY